jgi:hypothetical protein
MKTSEQREEAARRDLEQLVELLKKAAQDISCDSTFSGHIRAIAFGRADVLSATVDRLSKVLLDHSDADVRADRLIDFHDAAEAIATLAGGLKTPVAHPLRAAIATRGKSVKKDDETLVAMAKQLLRKHSSRTLHWVAGKISGDSEALKARGLESIKCEALYKRLKRLEPRIMSELEHQGRGTVKGDHDWGVNELKKHR